MSLLEVAADLRVRDGAANRVLNVTDWQVAATGAASQATLAALLAELGQKLEPADVAALATAARQDAAQAALSAMLAALQGTLTVAGPLTDAQARATPLPVSGTIATGGLSDAQLRASAVAVSGPQTDAQARATPQAVTGPLTDAQLRAVAVPVSGTVTVAGVDPGDFKRLAKAEPMAGEELRFDDISAGDLYIGAAPDATATSSASWKVCRYYRDAATGNILRARYRVGVAWDARTAGWT